MKSAVNFFGSIPLLSFTHNLKKGIHVLKEDRCIFLYFYYGNDSY